MKTLVKSLLVAGLLAATSYAAYSQPMGMGSHGPMMDRGNCSAEDGGKGMRGRMDPAKMEAFIAQRAAEAKQRLKITAAQEPAWNSFLAAMKPPAGMQQKHRPDPAELAALSTPQRLEKMRAQRDAHHTEMKAFADQRDEAVRRFYAQLTPDQQKVFDAEHLRLIQRQGKRGPMGGHEGQHPGAQ